MIFPHHESERAQSEAATGEPFVRHWMHTALIGKDGAKMSKSLGNLVFVDDLRKEWDPMVIRLAIVEHHYRTEWEWDDELMPSVGSSRAVAPGGQADRGDVLGRSGRASMTTSIPPGRAPRSTPLRPRGGDVSGLPSCQLGVLL